MVYTQQLFTYLVKYHSVMVSLLIVRSVGIHRQGYFHLQVIPH